MPDRTDDSKTENKEINLRRKAIGAFVLMTVLFIPVCAALHLLGRSYSSRREAQLERMNLNVLSHIAAYGNREFMEADECFDDHIRKEVDLMVSFLKEYVTSDGYAGPELFTDGFVIRLEGDRVILPARFSEAEVPAEKSLIEESIRSGSMRTGVIDAGDVSGSLSFGRISEDAVYAQITPPEERTQFLDHYKQSSLSALETATEMSGGMTLVMCEEEGRPVLLETFGDLIPEEEVQDLGLTMQALESRDRQNLKVGGQKYRYASAKADGEWLGHEAIYITQIIPAEGIVNQLLLAVLTCAMMMVLCVTIITYALSEEGYVLKHVLSENEARRYNPARLRHRLRSAGAVSTVSILVLAFLTQSVIQMHQISSNGKRTLQLLSGQLDSGSDAADEAVQSIKENWYLKYGTMTASFLEENTGVRTKEKMRECCEITGVDFILLFDHRGSEILCSSDYAGFTMDRGLGEDSSDFKRLLMGIDGIIHAPSLDETTGLERQMIGVPVDLADDAGEYGALILALMPGTTGTSGILKTEKEATLLLPGGTLCFAARKSTGEILYSSEPSLEGKTTEEAGAAENSLQDGYMDFGTILGINRFIVTYEDGNRIYYYAQDYRTLSKENLWYGVTAAVLFAVTLSILLAYLVRGYNRDAYKKRAVIVDDWKKAEWIKAEQKARHPETGGTRLEAALQEWIMSGRWNLNRKGAEHTDAGPVSDFLLRTSGWDSMLPEKRASVIFTIGLFILLQLWVILIPGNILMRGSGQTLLYYLLNGDWMHGFNMFAIYSILVSTSFVSLIIMGSGWLLQLISGFMSAKGQTICRLLRSLIKYVLIVAVIIKALDYVGLLNTHVLTSMGIGSLALSLGATDIIADILSGILIVFNETVRVGDVVEYGEITAEVQDVRIQSTQLRTLDDNDILIVRNREINSIINKSRTPSVCSLTMKIGSDIPLEKIETLLEKALPEIGAGCPEIIGVPQYAGMTELRNADTPARNSRQILTVEVDAYCEEKNKFDVRIYMNRQLYLLFKKEGIEVL